jgi:hypothetical protein
VRRNRCHDATGNPAVAPVHSDAEASWLEKVLPLPNRRSKRQLGASSGSYSQTHGPSGPVRGVIISIGARQTSLPLPFLAGTRPRPECIPTGRGNGPRNAAINDDCMVRLVERMGVAGSLTRGHCTWQRSVRFYRNSLGDGGSPSLPVSSGCTATTRGSHEGNVLLKSGGGFLPVARPQAKAVKELVHDTGGRTSIGMCLATHIHTVAPTWNAKRYLEVHKASQIRR